MVRLPLSFEHHQSVTMKRRLCYCRRTGTYFCMDKSVTAVVIQARENKSQTVHCSDCVYALLQASQPTEYWQRVTALRLTRLAAQAMLTLCRNDCHRD